MLYERLSKYARWKIKQVCSMKDKASMHYEIIKKYALWKIKQVCSMKD